MKFFEWIKVMRLPTCGVFLILLVVGNLHATEWQEVSRNFKLVIFVRHRVQLTDRGSARNWGIQWADFGA